MARFDGATKLVLVALMAVLLQLAPSRSFAQSTGILSSSYITPFPQTDRYQIRVIGDWLGNGLTAGLEEAFKQDGTVQITSMSRSNFGLARPEQNDLYGEIDRMLNGGPVHIVVIMLGASDRNSIRTATGRLQPGTAEWKDAYGKEAERLIKKLKAANVAVYWVGLPIMSNPSFGETVAAMNDAVRQAAYLNGVKFIETWTGFTDQLGHYSAYGPDLTGQTKRLRESDGIGLTPAGNRKLANYVEIILRRDLAQARQYRNIPLAGDEEEQARIVPGGSRPATAANAKGSVGPDAKQEPLPTPASQGQAGKGSGGWAAVAGAPNRPATTAAPEPARRDQAAYSVGFQQGEMILSDLGNGLTAIAVVSPGSEFTIRDIQQQTPLADRVYYRVLSRGEALTPKDGRADDFRWHGDSLSGSQ
jgi:hypothetical protein